MGLRTEWLGWASGLCGGLHLPVGQSPAPYPLLPWRHQGIVLGASLPSQLTHVTLLCREQCGLELALLLSLRDPGQAAYTLLASVSSFITGENHPKPA